MERVKDRIIIGGYNDVQTRLMNSLRKINLRSIIGHFLIIVFLALISYGLAGNIAVRSAPGIILACISLAATVISLWLLPRLYKQGDEEDWQG